MARRPAAAALLCLLVSAGCAEEWSPASMGADLACSACSLFVEQYLSRCSHFLYGAGRRELEGASSVLSVYQRRFHALYEEFDPSMTRGRKRKKLDALLAREVKKGLFVARRVHELYSKLCDKYGVEPEEIYEGAAPTGSEQEQKLQLTRAALNSTVAQVKSKEMQWAQSGKEPNRSFVDFNKAMSGGTTDSLSTGGDVADRLLKAFEFFAQRHNGTLTVAVANASRVYDSKLDKTFCIETAQMCKREAEAQPEPESPAPEDDVEDMGDHDEL